MQGFSHTWRTNPIDRRKGISYMMKQNSYRRITDFFTKTSILLACMLGVLSFFFIKFRLDTITVIGSNYYTEQELVNRITDSPLDSNTLLFYLTHRFGEQKKIPYIEQIDYVMTDTHTIEAQVYEKILVGCVKVMGQYMYFDKDGYVTESAQEQLPGVPLIKGLEFDRIVLYEKLKIQKDELYDIILNITKLVREYEIPARNVIFNGKGEVELETENCNVSLGKRAAYDLQIQKIADILPSITDRKLYIDLSGYEGGTEDIIAKPLEE